MVLKSGQETVMNVIKVKVLWNECLLAYIYVDYGSVKFKWATKSFGKTKFSTEKP